MPEIVTFGESMALLLTEPSRPLRQATHFVRSIAGAESNVAIGASRLGHRTGWFGRVGDDAFGQGALDTLRGEAVDISAASTDPNRPTGLCIRDWHAERRTQVLYYRHDSAGSCLSPDHVDPAYIATARILHVTGITPALSDSCRAAVYAAMQAARERGVTVSFDPNLRLRLWSPQRAAEVMEPLLALAEIVLAGDGETARLSQRTGAADGGGWFLERGAGLVAVKQGADGAWATDGENAWKAPAHPVTPVDAVGAGDAFTAGFLSAWLRDMDVERCLTEANVTAAMSVQTPGDITGLPYRSDVDATLAHQREVDR